MNIHKGKGVRQCLLACGLLNFPLILMNRLNETESYVFEIEKIFSISEDQFFFSEYLL